MEPEDSLAVRVESPDRVALATSRLLDDDPSMSISSGSSLGSVVAYARGLEKGGAVSKGPRMCFEDPGDVPEVWIGAGTLSVLLPVLIGEDPGGTDEVTAC